jgi:hypothetical protein
VNIVPIGSRKNQNPDRHGKGGATMQREQDNVHAPDEESPKKPGLLAKARTRAKQEYSLSLSADTPHYAAAALGQSPYIAVGNGFIVVQRKCDTWSC